MRQAAATPEGIAYTFLFGRDAAEESITYAELDRKAQAIGAELQSRGLEGERAVLMCEPGLAFAAAFFGCLYAGTIAVPICPPRRNRGLGRIRSVVCDCNPAIMLVGHDWGERCAALANDAPELADLPWLAVNDLADHLRANWRPSHFGPERIALLQYTSGSPRSRRA